jgi:hypothetical protein
MKPAAQVPGFTVRQWIKLGKQIGVLRTGRKKKRPVKDEISGILDLGEKVISIGDVKVEDGEFRLINPTHNKDLYPGMDPW